MSLAGAAAGRFRRPLLASEGRPFSPAVLERVMMLAAPGALVTVLAVARVWGTAFGFPNPWLMPSRHELKARREQVEAALRELEARGIAGEGRVIGTRSAARRIAKLARQSGADLIVMGADPSRGHFRDSLSWAQEPRRVARRASVPVVLVEE